MKRCPFCAEKMQEIAIVCPHCGRDYPHNPELTSVPPTDRVPLPGKGILLLAGVIFMLLVLSGWIFSMFRFRNVVNDQNRYLSVIAQQKTMLAVSQAKLDTLSMTLSTAQAGSGQSDQLAGFQATATNQANQIATQAKQLADANVKQVKLCADFGKIDFDYASNDAILKQLEAYAAQVGGDVSKSTYILPWVNPNIAVYSLKAGKYAFMFVGYFNLGTEVYPNSLYWIDGMCYLDIESP